MNTHDCIVIGAGASGLVAAACLARAGRSVLVLEATERVGGCIHSWRPQPDFWLELGAHTAYNSYAPLLEALAERGGLQNLQRREKLSYRFLTPQDKLQSPLARLSFLEAVISLPSGLRRSKDGRSVADWFGGLLGRRNYRNLLAPAFAAVLSQSADNFPAEWLFRKKPRMKAAPRKFTYPGGLQGLLEALVEGAPFQVRTQSPVQAVERTGEGYRIRLNGESSESSLTCRQLVLAVPVDQAALLLAETYPDLAHRLQVFPISSSEALAVTLPASKTRLPAVAGLIGLDDAFWSVVTRDPVPHPTLRGFTFHFRSGLLDSTAKLQRAAQVLGVTPEDFLQVRETVNRLPAPGVEHVRLTAEIDASLVREPLALVGNYLIGLSIGDCAERAVKEAERLLNL